MTKFLLLLLVALILFLLFRRYLLLGTDNGEKFETHSYESNNANENSNSSETGTLLQPIDTLEDIGNLPVWFNFEPRESNTAIYERTFWEVEPFGEYIYYLAGDYTQGHKGHLNFTTPFTVFSVITTFEIDSVDVGKREQQFEHALAEESSVDVDDFLPLTVENIVDRYKSKLENDIHNSEYVSLMHLMPIGAYGCARLSVGHNWFDNEGLMLTLEYDEIRAPSTHDEKERLVSVTAHCRKMEQPLQPLMDQFISLVDRYKAMPYFPLSGATRY